MRREPLERTRGPARAAEPRPRRDEHAIAALQRTAGNRAVTALVARMRLTDDLRRRVPLMNARQLRETYMQALDDHDTLTNRIQMLQDVQEMRELQVALLRRIDSPALKRLDELARMGPVIEAKRVQLNQLRQGIEQALAQQIDTALAAEFGHFAPFDPTQAAAREQGMQTRRGQLLGSVPEYASVNAQLGEIKRFNDEFDRLVAEVEVQMRAALTGVQTRQTTIHTQRIWEMLAAVRDYRPQEVATRLAEMRQELSETDQISAGVREIRGRTPLITLAQDVVGETQSLLAVGAGNQISDLQRSAGLSQELTVLVRAIARFPPQNPLMAISQEALLARTLHAGNCEEHAAVAFALLWQRLNGAQLTFYRHRIDHAFVIIGDPRDPNTAVVCDPWPRQAEALLLRDFFVQHGITDLRNVFYTGVANGADLTALARPTVDIDSAEARMEEERRPLSSAEADQRWRGQRGFYQHDSTRM